MFIGNSSCLLSEEGNHHDDPLSNSVTTNNNNNNKVQDFSSFNPLILQSSHIMIPPSPPVLKIKKKRNLPGNPDPDAEVIALSPKTLLATNRFVCEICNKGFQRDQNLQLHRRGHNLPWKLKQRNNNNKENKKRVYVCPETTCVHHHPSRALGDLTGIKKHFCRKHGEKKWKCDKCSKFYAVQSDWKAHTKTCGTREYRCDCGTLFSRKDSFITHRAFCDALAEESARLISSNSIFASPTSPAVVEVAGNDSGGGGNPSVPFYSINNSQSQNPSSLFLPFSSSQQHTIHFPNQTQISLINPWNPSHQNPNPNPNPKNPNHNNNNNNPIIQIKPECIQIPNIPNSTFYQEPPPQPLITLTTHQNADDTADVLPILHYPLTAATALLQKASSSSSSSSLTHVISSSSSSSHVNNSIMTHHLLLDDRNTLGHVSTGIPPPPPLEFPNFQTGNLSTWQKSTHADRLTRDFLGLTGDHDHDHQHHQHHRHHQCNGKGNVDVDVNVHVNMNMGGMMVSSSSSSSLSTSRTLVHGNVVEEFPASYNDLSLLKNQSFGFAAAPASETWENC